ncbi:MAG: chorismate synthase [Cyclobacteriaceae bacterium]|nr:MAG: chorismate synthase [Cyclobacteriaceae bacterium]
MGNSFGKLFRITTFGESHGQGIGVIIDGCPAGLDIDLTFIQQQLDRRKPGQSKITTQRKESDEFQVLSGIFEGKSTGTPLGMVIWNKDARSKDYSHIAGKFRPSHADFTYQEKYGIRDYRGGGRSSARETAARVAAGGVAMQLLQQHGIQVKSFVSQVGHIKLKTPYTELDLDKIEDNIVRCPHSETAEAMIKLIDTTRKAGDSIGGVITGVLKGVPAGLGEPVFDKLHALLGSAMLGINAVKGFEYGSGFEGVSMKGSEHNDRFEKKDDAIVTTTNFSGGIQGGISNGQDIYFRVAFKPVATIMKDQQSMDQEGNPTIVKGKGRHDPCVVPRAVPIVDAMSALVLADCMMMNKSAKL